MNNENHTQRLLATGLTLTGIIGLFIVYQLYKKYMPYILLLRTLWKMLDKDKLKELGDKNGEKSKKALSEVEEITDGLHKLHYKKAGQEHVIYLPYFFGLTRKTRGKRVIWRKEKQRPAEKGEQKSEEKEIIEVDMTHPPGVPYSWCAQDLEQGTLHIHNQETGEIIDLQPNEIPFTT